MSALAKEQAALRHANGTLVRSLAGRDAGYLLCVVGEKGGMLLLCDGKERPLGRPKRKNPRHVQAEQGIPPLNEEVLRGNKALRKALRALDVGH